MKIPVISHESTKFEELEIRKLTESVPLIVSFLGNC
jgi:hypothetical protein